MILAFGANPAGRRPSSYPDDLSRPEKGRLKPVREMKTWLVFLFVVVSSSVGAQVGIINTFAGNGTNTNSGDGGLAINAGIYQPSWGIFDKEGDYYVVSGLGNKIRKINTAGIITTYAGTGMQGYSGDGGLADTSKLNLPASITLDSFGNLYIADAQNDRVRKVDKLTGIITTVAGTGISGFSGDNGMAAMAQLDGPNDMCFDKEGNLYISDANNARIRRITPQGTITTIAGTGPGPYNGDEIPAISANLNMIRCVAVDDTGNLYIVEQNSRVRKVDTNGIIHTVAGTGIPTYNGDNIPATAANMNPYRVCFDATGTLHITDFGNKRIRKVDVNGIIHTIAGNGIQAYAGDGGPADSASLNGPSGITFDSCGNLYITEVNQGRIRKVTYNPNCNQVDTVDTTASVYNLTAIGSISIYPNPAREQLTITGGSGAEDIMIVNAIGQLMQQHSYSGRKATINVSSLDTGIYYIIAKDEKSGKVVRMKFLKE